MQGRDEPTVDRAQLRPRIERYGKAQQVAKDGERLDSQRK
jgi:hypothetical protein